MCMVGYEDGPDVPGGGFFLVRNSWGTTWGRDSAIEPGYARIPYAYIEQYGSAAYVARVATPPEEGGRETLLDWLCRLWRRLFH